MSAKGRVAVLDDEVLLLELFKLVLTEAGYEVVASTELERAHDLVLTTHPDVVLLDLMAAGEPKGYEALEALRADGTTSDVPVVVCSVLSEPLLKTLQRDGRITVLAKPFELPELLSAVDDAAHR
ncbi:MAG TPA: response regulator [Chloroflexota bacterium]|nr:response regulator [Chloroflexota bacterium]